MCYLTITLSVSSSKWSFCLILVGCLGKIHSQKNNCHSLWIKNLMLYWKRKCFLEKIHSYPKKLELHFQQDFFTAVFKLLGPICLSDCSLFCSQKWNEEKSRKFKIVHILYSRFQFWWWNLKVGSWKFYLYSDSRLFWRCNCKAQPNAANQCLCCVALPPTKFEYEFKL